MVQEPRWVFLANYLCNYLCAYSQLLPFWSALCLSKVRCNQNSVVHSFSLLFQLIVMLTFADLSRKVLKNYAKCCFNYERTLDALLFSITGPNFLNHVISSLPLHSCGHMYLPSFLNFLNSLINEHARLAFLEFFSTILSISHHLISCNKWKTFPTIL